MTSRVLVALRIKASPQRVFDAFTREINAWWQPNAMFQFTPRSPGVLSFEAPAGGGQGRLIETLKNGKVFEVGRVRVWEPGVRLVFGWRQATFAPGIETEVEVSFEPVGSETRVTVEHRGWDRIPGDHVAKHGFPELFFMRRHGEWWQALLSALASRIG